jgi:hypothetical protein
MQESQDTAPVEKSDNGQEPPIMQETQDTTPADEPDVGPESEKSTDTRKIIGIALIAVVVLAIVGLTIYGMVTHPILTSVLRDISIIVLALVTLIIGLFLIVLIFQLQSLIVLLRDEIRPILDSANETANTVRGTTTFVSDAVVTPLIHVASLASGVVQTLRTLAGTGHKAKRRTRTKPDPTQK